jgi:hypothetical protein
MKPEEDILAFLLKLNLELTEKESRAKPSRRRACRHLSRSQTISSARIAWASGGARNKRRKQVGALFF